MYIVQLFLQESIGELIPAIQREERHRGREGGSHFAASADGEGREGPKKDDSKNSGPLLVVAV
jgi:hypothetical protein